jgi:hypothetical protein
VGLQAVPAYARILNHPAELDRNVLRALFSRSGAARYGDFAVTPTGTTRQFQIAPGRAHVLGIENSQQGGYVGWSDVAENLVLAAPSATPRIDTVLMRIYDEQYGTLPSGTSRVQWDIVQGTPNASPAVLPDSAFISTGAQYVPGAWWRLCDIRTNPGDTTIPAGQIYPANTFVRVPGAETLCLSVGSTTGFGGRPTDPVLGERIFELDTKIGYRWNGVTWLRDSVRIKLASLQTYTNTTMVDVPGFQFFGEINQTYKIYNWLHTVAPTASDLSMQWVLPAGATVEWTLMGPSSVDSAGVVTTVYQGAIVTTGVLTIGGEASSGVVGQVIGTVSLGGTGGICKLQASQGTAGGSSFIRPSSWMTIEHLP